MQTIRLLRRASLRAVVAAGAAAAASSAAPPLRRGRSPAVVAAAAAGAAMELPPAAGAPIALAAAAAVVARRRPGWLAGAAAGTAAALGTSRLWPVPPRAPAQTRARLTLASLDGAAGDGEGLTVVVNPAAGSALRRSPTDALRESLPAARIVELGEDDDLPEVLEQAAATSRAIGMAGGDGSLSAAAAVAHRAGKPLVVVPAGTLNHLARDLGVDGVDDAVDAVRAGRGAVVDVSSIDGHTFLNTASFGAYSELVDRREQLEDAIGKWPALVVALLQVLHASQPVRVEIDGRERRLWMIFVGNCRYRPAGFAPSWRERLDDGELDVRLVDASPRFARARLLAAVLTGRLARCRSYEAFTARSLQVRSLDGPLRLACDGETFDGSAAFEVRKEPEPLTVYVPEDGDEKRAPVQSSRRRARPTTTSSTTSTAAPTAVSHGPAAL